MTSPRASTATATRSPSSRPGACNPSGITLTLSHALRQIIAEGGSQCADPAVRLIVHQLAFLVNADHIDPAEYGRLLDACRAKADTAS